MQTDKVIIVRGARQHNLQNIDLRLPRDRLIVVTGLSGSGKSTLAFDTLYAEGQRRYVESLSTYARQFLERLEKPDVDLIDGLSPAIAIEQKSASHNPRSTVGTVTEIYDYLRLLYARIGMPFCPQCGRAIETRSLDQLVDRLMGLEAGIRLIILAPLVTDRTGPHKQLIARLRKEGFARVCIDDRIYEIDEVGRLADRDRHTIQVVVDRLVVRPTIRNRLADSLELALARSDGRLTVQVLGQGPAGAGQPVETLHFSDQPVCLACDLAFPELQPASFSFNAPQGACPDCDGLGTVSDFDPEMIVPNPTLSLREGAVAPWAHRSTVLFSEFLESLTRHYGTDIYTPFQELPESFRQVLMHGSQAEKIAFHHQRGKRKTVEPKPFEGIIPNLRRRYLETQSTQAREDIRKYQKFNPCSACKGTRLNPVARSVRIAERTICQVTALSVDRALGFFGQLSLKGQRAVIGRRLIREITDRLAFLQDVGLGYLTLDRSAATLSGGESQRIRLATQIGAKLTGVLYVLDEPSIGLHPRDNRRLLDTLVRMRDLGNTVLVVEHDEETILRADHVVELGPGAGVSGGKVVFNGPPTDLLGDTDSLTGRYLSGRLRIEVPSRRRQPVDGSWLKLQAASANNLKNIDVAFPLGCLVCVTGVSGSGKSTLVIETLYRALSQHLYHARVSAGAHQGIEGLERIDKIVNIDQSPIGRTPRSNPGTYSGLFTDIRELFARTPEARMRGYKSGRFSFNVKGGRCEACGGGGIVKIEMHFLPDVYVNCDVCRGKRYNRETLEIRYKGRNIAEVLDLTVNQCLEFFGKLHRLRSKLETLQAVGIGYVRMGQSATTLSGGEAQRLKLSRELSRRGTGRTVYILDEPTTGLHVDDVSRLLGVLDQLVEAGNTVIVIEHQLDVIKSADWIVDLGPEGGDAGGRVVAAGPPEQIAAHPDSHTGRYLKKVMGRARGQGKSNLEIN